jgi:hypothetical protein
MSIELDQVRELRPDVPSPTSHAREAARDQLRMAVAREVETTTRSSQPAPPKPIASPATAPAGTAARRRGIGGGCRRGWGDAVNVLISPAQLPGSVQLRAGVYERLAHVLSTSTTVRTCPIPGHPTEQLASIPCAVAQSQARHRAAAVTVAVGGSPRVERQIAQADQLPGVSTQRVDDRACPHGDLAAQVIGTVGPISANADPAASPQVGIGQSALLNRAIRVSAPSARRSSRSPRPRRCRAGCGPSTASSTTRVNSVSAAAAVPPQLRLRRRRLTGSHPRAANLVG